MYISLDSCHLAVEVGQLINLSLSDSFPPLNLCSSTQTATELLSGWSSAPTQNLGLQRILETVCVEEDSLISKGKLLFFSPLKDPSTLPA